MNTVSIRRFNQTFTLWRATLNRRYNCALPYFAAFFACNKENRYFVTVWALSLGENDVCRLMESTDGDSPFDGLEWSRVWVRYPIPD